MSVGKSSILALTGGFALAGCAVVPERTTTAPPPPTPPVVSTHGLERVLGHDARSLIALFGEPQLDVHEASARKLQFASSICVLDAYLYPTPHSREPVVTYVDARQPNGTDIDRASCVAALVAKQGR